MDIIQLDFGVFPAYYMNILNHSFKHLPEIKLVGNLFFFYFFLHIHMHTRVCVCVSLTFTAYI